MVSLEAKEDRSGKLFYDHEMIKIEALSEATPQSGGAIHQQPSGPHKGLLNQYTKLVLSVNPNSASRTINPETGEPLVVYHGTGERLWKFKHGEEGGSFFTTNVCLEEPGILSLDAGLDLQEHDGKAQPWQRDSFPDSR